MPENPLQIYLCRHGETAWTVSGQHTGKTDVPLTERGRMQAECLKKRLAGIPFDAVLSSPLQRASETCHLAGFHPILEPNAAEWNYGDFEGLTYQQICEKKHPWSIFLNGAQGGESLMQVSHRADLVLQRLLSHALERHVPSVKRLDIGDVYLPASAKVDMSIVDIHTDQLHADPIAYIELFVAMRESALNRKRHQPHPGSFETRSRYNRFELLTNLFNQQHRCSTLIQPALDLCCRIFFFCAMHGNLHQLPIAIWNGLS